MFVREKKAIENCNASSTISAALKGIISTASMLLQKS